jgi:hypothetical protein
MDIGAAFCRPRDPHCDACPLRAMCRYESKRAEEAPQTSTRRAAASADPLPRFVLTTRWLRGRIIDRLRDAPNGDWVTFGAAIGAHDRAAVVASLSRLSTEGMIELDNQRARLVG